MQSKWTTTLGLLLERGTIFVFSLHSNAFCARFKEDASYILVEKMDSK